MLTCEEKFRIVEDRLKFLGRQRHELRKEYQDRMMFEGREVDADTGYVTIRSWIPAKDHDELIYKIRLCAVQARALQEELRRLYTEEQT